MTFSAEAVAVIKSGDTALLPPGRWDLANEVLIAFDVPKAERVRALTFSQHQHIPVVEGLAEPERDAVLHGLVTYGGQDGSPRAAPPGQRDTEPDRSREEREAQAERDHDARMAARLAEDLDRSLPNQYTAHQAVSQRRRCALGHLAQEAGRWPGGVDSRIPARCAAWADQHVTCEPSR